jgi:hypothetical protein
MSGDEYGHLVVMCPHQPAAAIRLVREAVVEAYRQDDVHQPNNPDVYALWADTLFVRWEDPPRRNDDPVLGEDELFLNWHARTWGTMVFVKSHRWEITPPGRHPLAMRLSERWPVLSVGVRRHGEIVELCLYRHGRLVQHVNSDPDAKDGPAGTPLNFRWLAQLAGSDEQTLRERFGGDVDRFLQHSRLDSRVERFCDMFEPCDIYGYDESTLLLFRTPDRVDWQPRRRCELGCGSPVSQDDWYCEDCAEEQPCGLGCGRVIKVRTPGGTSCPECVEKAYR